MSTKLTAGDKAAMKYLGIRLCSWILIFTEIIGGVSLIGTVGAIERDSIELGRGIIQLICIIAAMLFIGFIVWVIESISPYILKRTKQILREEKKAKRQKAMQQEQNVYDARYTQRMHV